METFYYWTLFSYLFDCIKLLFPWQNFGNKYHFVYKIKLWLCIDLLISTIQFFYYLVSYFSMAPTHIVLCLYIYKTLKYLVQIKNCHCEQILFRITYMYMYILYDIVFELIKMYRNLKKINIISSWINTIVLCISSICWGKNIF